MGITKGVKSLGLLFYLLACAVVAQATSVVIPTDNDLIIGARAIIIGKVVSTDSKADSHDNIFTYTTLEVLRVLKGNISAGRVVIKEEGGEVGGYGSVFTATPQFSPGEEVLLYLDTWPDGSLRVHQMFLGKYGVNHDPTTNRLFVVRAVASEAEVLLSESADGAVTNSMELEAYVEMVIGRLTLNADACRQFEARHYRNRPLLTHPPEYRPRAESSTISPHYVLLSPAVRWFEPDAGRPVVFMVSPEGAPFPQAEADMTAAMDVWSSVAGVNLRVINGGASAQCSPVVGTNLIRFNDCDGRWSPSPGCSGILAQTSWRYTTTSPRQVNGVTFYKLTQAVISFNPYASCHLARRCNIQEVAAHEMGHALGLAHAGETSQGSPTAGELDATMYPIIHFDARCGALRADDVNGILAIYGGAAQAGSPAIITGNPASSAVLESSYLQTLAVTGGAPPYTWRLSPGSGALPPGLILTTDGHVAGVPSATGSFSFAAEVTDSLLRTASKQFSIVVTDAPSIALVKYKRGKKRLTVYGRRFDPGVTLLVGTTRLTPDTYSGTQLVVKRLALTDGSYELKVVNSNGVFSESVRLNVN